MPLLSDVARQGNLDRAKSIWRHHKPQRGAEFLQERRHRAAPITIRQLRRRRSRWRIAALYFFDVLSGERLLVERDLGEFFITPRMFWLVTVKQGSFPFWNPYYHPFIPLLYVKLYPKNHTTVNQNQTKAAIPQLF
mgnify:CR=1 FL=1